MSDVPMADQRIAEKVAVIQKMRRDMGLRPMPGAMAESLARIALSFIDGRDAGTPR